jgi:hypothetical protein
MKKLLILLFAVAPMMAQANAELESRIEALEERAMLDIFNFSGNLKYFYDNINAETYAGTVSKGNWQRMSFGLNINAAPYENLKVYSSLRMTKFINTVFGDKSTTNAGLTPSRDFNGSQIYVEKAYADYSLTDSLVFSFGRMPTIDGVPVNYKDGKAIMGTYPLMAYAATLDGLALTYKAMDSLALRLVYTPFMGNPYIAQDNDSGTPDTGTTPPTADDDQVDYTFNNDNHNAELITFMADYNRSFSWSNNFNAVLQYSYIPKYDIIRAVTGTASGTTVGMMAEVALTTLHLEAMNLMNSGVNLSVSHLMTKYTNSDTGTALTSYELDKTGAGTLIALQYTGFNNKIIGLHAITSDKDYRKFDTTNDEIGAFNRQNGMETFVSTVGSGMDLYYTHKFEPTFSATLGYMTQDIDAVNWGEYGALPADTSDSKKKEIKTAYLRLNLDF